MEEDCGREFVFAMRYSFAMNLHRDAYTACELLRNVDIPGCVRMGAPLIPLVGLVVGPVGAETSSHKHDAAFNYLYVGEKIWNIEGYDEFVQRQGDVVFIPHRADHRVVNSKPSLAWTFQFHKDHFLTKTGIPETESLFQAESSVTLLNKLHVN